MPRAGRLAGLLGAAGAVILVADRVPSMAIATQAARNVPGTG